jgi:hypothetical protein
MAAGSPLPPEHFRRMGKIGGAANIARHGSDAVAARARAGLLARIDAAADVPPDLDPATRDRLTHEARSRYFRALVQRRWSRDGRQRDAAAETGDA